MTLTLRPEMNLANEEEDEFDASDAIDFCNPQLAREALMERYMLVGIGKCTQGLTHLLEPGTAVVIGRHTDCTIVIASDVCRDVDRVSRQHAVLEDDQHRWSVHDTGSANGTVVLAGGLPPAVQLDAGEAQTLNVNDVIELAGSRDVSFLFTTAHE